MKLLFTSLMIAGFILFSAAQDTALHGTWYLTELSETSGGETLRWDDGDLKNAGLFWEITFKGRSGFFQNSNMSQSGTVSNREGTWRTSGNNLTMAFNILNRDIEVKYQYRVSQGSLLLERSDPARNISLVAVFSKRR